MGLCEAGTETIRRAHGVQSVTAVQSEYRCGGASRRPRCCLPAKRLASALCPTVRLAVASYGCDRRDDGFRQQRQPRTSLPRFTPGARKANRPVIDLLRTIGDEKGASPAQIALAWLLAQKPWIVPIPGTTKLSRIDQNIGTSGIALKPADLARIDQAVSQITVRGGRYPQTESARINR